MEIARQVVAFTMLLVLLLGGVAMLWTSEGKFLAGAIVAAVFMLLFLILTMEDEEHG